MKKEMRIGFAITLTVLCSLYCQAQGLKELKSVYERHCAEITLGYSTGVEQTQTQYLSALETLRTFATDRKDLKQKSDVITEIARFRKTKTLPSAPDTNQVPEIVRAQSIYVQTSLQLEKTCAEKSWDLTTKYWEKLDKLRQELTESGKTDEAKAVARECDNAVALMKKFKDQVAAIKESLSSAMTTAEAKASPAAPTLNRTGAPQPKPGKETEKLREKNAKTHIIDINSAAKDELILLPGIGDKMADRIIASRPFRKKQDLMNVSGIGQKKFDDLKDLIEVKPATRK